MTGIVWFKHSNGDTFFLALLHQRQHVNTIKEEALSLSKCKVKKKQVVTVCIILHIYSEHGHYLNVKKKEQVSS